MLSLSEVPTLGSNLAGRQGFEPRYRGPERSEAASVISIPVCFVREIVRNVAPSPVGDALFLRRSSSFREEFPKLPQLGEFRLRLFQYRDIGVGIFPER